MTTDARTQMLRNLLDDQTYVPEAPATWIKLRSGQWGARVPNDFTRTGSVIRIETKAGRSQWAQVTAVVHRGADYTLVAVATMDATAAGLALRLSR